MAVRQCALWLMRFVEVADEDQVLHAAGLHAARLQGFAFAYLSCRGGVATCTQQRSDNRPWR